jgi:diguanylate cyclase (GGDEF)-like protein
MVGNLPDADGDYVQDVVELRRHIVRSLQGSSEAIVKDTIAVYPFAGMESIALDHLTPLAGLIFQLITHAIRDGTLDSRTGAVAELGQMMGEKEINLRGAFNIAYLMERSALDELAVDESFGATSEPWPVIAQMVRRASFDVCAAFSEYATRDMGHAGLIDPLTTLHTRAVFLAALEREIKRAERFGRPFALILLDVDHLAEINTKHGFGAGDRIIERIGIVVRNYFRETDWVARSSGDTFAVLLPEIQGVDAARLADRMRIMVQERLQLHDYRSDQQFPVTVTAGVLIAETVDRSVRAEQLLTEAKEAVNRAKQAGRNRVERVDAVLGREVAPTREGMSMD